MKAQKLAFGDGYTAYGMTKYFGLFRWWIGVGIKWKICYSCKTRHTYHYVPSSGVKYFQIGYFHLSIAKKP